MQGANSSKMFIILEDKVETFVKRLFQMEKAFFAKRIQLDASKEGLLPPQLQMEGHIFK